jgi:3-methyladenine DNA glycosylase AlkD
MERLVAAFEPHRDPTRAAQMSAYLREQFPFLGIMKTERVALMREALAGLDRPTELDLAAVAAACWKRPEREYQYAGAWFLRRHARILGPGFIGDAERLIVTKSWWDTVDDLAANVVGSLVRAHELGGEMDRWIGSANFWLARAAILHQLRYRAGTDDVRLFGYCRRRGSDTEFFIRKAIGWALREYTKTDHRAVLAFLREHGAELSPLSRREAVKWIEASRS